MKRVACCVFRFSTTRPTFRAPILTRMNRRVNGFYRTRQGNRIKIEEKYNYKPRSRRFGSLQTPSKGMTETTDNGMIRGNSYQGTVNSYQSIIPDY